MTLTWRYCDHVVWLEKILHLEFDSNTELISQPHYYQTTRKWALWSGTAVFIHIHLGTQIICYDRFSDKWVLYRTMVFCGLYVSSCCKEKTEILCIVQLRAFRQENIVTINILFWVVLASLLQWTEVLIITYSDHTRGNPKFLCLLVVRWFIPFIGDCSPVRLAWLKMSWIILKGCKT